MPNIALDESRIRITIFSPHKVGMVLTRKSILLRSVIFSFIRPSCGLRFSAISSRDITLIRAESLVANVLGGLATSCKMPSIRKRIRYLCSYGSKCKSEAPFLMASIKILLIYTMIGASSLSSSCGAVSLWLSESKSANS